RRKLRHRPGDRDWLSGRALNLQDSCRRRFHHEGVAHECSAYTRASDRLGRSRVADLVAGGAGGADTMKRRPLPPRPWIVRLVVIVPYVWLLLFFLVPF